jgi:outer membrane protein assembly factor BamB
MKKSVLLAALVFLLLLNSCSVKNDSVDMNSAEVSDMTESLEKTPAIYQGLIVFLAGEVTINRQGVDAPVNIGDTVNGGEIIKTAAGGYCEIQFGNTAVIRLEENTIYKIESMTRDGSETGTGTRLIQGTILCKVNKLTDKSRFQIQTTDSVCGVRGTEFLVRIEGPSTRIAVKEGSVFVLPVQFDLTNDPRPEAREAFKLILGEAPLVNTGQELLLDGDDFRDKEELLDLILTSFSASIEQGETPETERLRSFTREQTASLLQGKNTINPADAIIIEEMKSLEQMELIPFPDVSGNEPLILLRVFPHPEDATVLINGSPVGIGSFTGLYKKSAPLTIIIQKDGFIEKAQEFQPGDQSEQIVDITLVKIEAAPKKPSTPPSRKSKTVTVSIKTDPSDARLTVNGKVYTGRFSGDFKAEEDLTLSAEKQGYQSETMSLKAYRAEGLVFKLKPAPVWLSLDLTSESIIGGAMASSGIACFNNISGKLWAVSKEGKVLWSYQTGNTVTENSQPVISGNHVYLSGDRELVSLNLKTGVVAGKFPMTPEDNHLFGKRVAVTETGVWLPLKYKNLLLEPVTLATIKENSLTDEIRMTPVAHNQKLYILDITGTWITLDGATGLQLASLPTGARDSVAMAPFIQDGKAFFSGRKGSLICMDLELNSILWEVPLPPNTQVFTDIAGEGAVITLFTGTMILAFSKDNGKLLYTVHEASSPPLTKKGKLYYGTSDGNLVISDLNTGEVMKRFDVGETITTKPLLDFGILFAGTETGKILFIIPEAIP